MNRADFKVEICANGVESCLSAQKAGADRVELCNSIPEGGTTPSYAEIRQARQLLKDTRLHVIIRPRGGDFIYSALEAERMMMDIDIAHELGADGVVFGCLTPEGNVDIPLCRQLMQQAKGMSVTFHRAFDCCQDPRKSLEDIISLGCNRILTSGQASTAELGIGLLKELQVQANGRIILLAGCGVNEQNIAKICKETGISEFHFSAREPVLSTESCQNSLRTDEFDRRFLTTERRVKTTIDALIAGI